ncbi:MAG: hypothetical protein WCO77_03515 [bacterium]
MKRLMNSRVRKVLCRLMGDKTGGVMMEYVILAVLIAAAVVVAVAMFGKTLVGMFDVAGKAATTREKTAKSTLDTTRTEQDTKAQEAKDYHDSMHESN